MIKDFSQMTEQELEDVRELEQDDEGLFQQLRETNQPNYIVKALENNEYSANSKTIAGLIPTKKETGMFYLVKEKVLIFNDELSFTRPPVK